MTTTLNQDGTVTEIETIVTDLSQFVTAKKNELTLQTRIRDDANAKIANILAELQALIK